jgi:chaperonin GroES
VTVKLDPKVDRTAGGLVIPDMAEASHRMGTVVAVGPGPKDEPILLQPGDRVMVGVQKDREGRVMNLGGIIVDGAEVALINYHDIWGTV